MGQYPNPVTYSPKPKMNPKVGQDPMIFAPSCAPPSTGCRSPKIGQYDQETLKTWSKANNSHGVTPCTNIFGTIVGDGFE
jgi:hypothetical protein